MTDINHNATYSNKDDEYHKFFPADKQDKDFAYKFQTELHAEDFMSDAFRHNGFSVKRQVPIANNYGIIDIVATKVIDQKELIIPVEVKPWFRGASEISKATFQASDYAKRTNYPFFIGPIVGRSLFHTGDMNKFLSFMCRLNVGCVFVGDNMSIAIYLEPSISIYSRSYSNFFGRVQEKVLWSKWGMRSQNLSKSKMKAFYEGRYDG